MEKSVLRKITIISIAVFGISTPNIFAEDFTNENLTNNDGVALIAQGIGEFTCSNEKQLKNMNIFVLLSEPTRRGLESGPSGLGLKSTENNENIAIKLNRGEVNSDNFHVEGISQVDDFCNTEYSVIFTADGSCGNGKIITVQGSDGSFGTFESNVFCSPHN